MRLVGVNEVVYRDARLLTFPPPDAHRGRETTVEATFRNTGNVPFAPRARVLVRRAGASGSGPVAKVLAASSERVPPGRTGHVRATFSVPAHSGPLEMTAQLVDGARTVDERTASVTPTNAPSLTRRVALFVTEHAIEMVSFLALMLLVLAGAGAGYIRRLKAGRDDRQPLRADRRARAAQTGPR
jgi:hypothetical protein